MSTCRDCPADCFWAITLPKRRRMLVDAEPVYGGNLDVDLDETPPTATVVKPDPNVKRHVSHFVTCPAAERRRR